jgi:hypothetical protein
MIEPTRDSSAATAPDAVVSAEKRWRKFIRWFSDGKIVVGLLVGALIGIGTLVDTVDRLQVFLGLKRSAALQLAEDNFQSQLTRDLDALAWKRMFWMRHVIQDATIGAEKARSDEIWKKYFEVLEEWNTKLMLHIILLERYYGPDRSEEFEHTIQPIFVSAHRCLMKLHTGLFITGESECGAKPTSKDEDIAVADARVNEANKKLYFFIRRTQPK